MKEVTGFAQWLLEKDIRAKNAVSMLAGLLSVGILYFLARHSEWFQEIKGEGSAGIYIVLVGTLLTGFLVAWLAWSGIAAIHFRASLNQRKQNEVKNQIEVIRNNLLSLTEWQRNFLLRFIDENINQIPEHEVGRFEAVWRPKVEILVNKRIVKHHRRARVFEINPEYRDCLLHNIDPETGDLN